MNKNLFFGMFVAAGMLLATSCSNDELEVAQSGNEAQVTFSLGLEGGIGSRAISDGTGAKKLVYAVYNANGGLINTIANADANGQIIDNAAFDNGLTENVTITLAKGQKYTVAFWAQNPNCTAYTTTDLKSVKVNYNGLNNDETRDAFFKAETFTVTGNTEIDVELNRPFAQINVGVHRTEDWDKAVASGVTIEKSKVTIKSAANTINLLTGAVTGAETVEYGFATIPEKFTTPETLDVDLDGDGTKEKYVYLSMSYILANDNTTGYAKTTLEDLDFTFRPEEGNEIVYNDVKFGEGAGLTNVPVQRNWRTNIIGKILTGDITFNITIDPIYDGEYNNGEALPVNINGVYYANIQDAVDAVKSGEVIKVATGTYAEVVNVTGGKNFTLEAAGPNVVVAGLDHQSNANHSTVKVKGITFDNSLNVAGWFTGTSPNINPCVGAWGGNLSFENCKFIVAGSSKKETGVMTWWTGDNLMTLSFNNCTFEGKDNHSSARAMQIYGDVNMSVTNCTFTTAKDYTLKYVATEGNVATFSNNIVNNSNNFVELGSSVYPGDKYTANINNNTLGEGVNTHVIANPENQTVNLNGNVQVIAEGLTKDESGNYVASSQNGLNNAITEGASEILLNEGSYSIPTSAAGKTLTFTGTGNPEETVINIPRSNQNASGASLEFDGVTIKSTNNNYYGIAHTNSCTFTNCIIIDKLSLYSKTVFDNCTFKTSTEHCVWTYGSKDVTFKNCKFEYSDRCVNVYSEGVKTTAVVFEDCVFTAAKTDSKGAVEINSSAFPEGVTVEFSGCVSPTYGEMAFISGWDSTNGATATVTVDGTTVTVPQLQK